MKWTKLTLKRNYCFLKLLLLFQSCGFFTFSSAQVGTDVHSFSIAPFHSETSDAPVDLQTTFVDTMQAHISRVVNLDRVENNGDIHYAGAILSFVYNTIFKPVGGNAAESDSQEEKRLTITVKVSYTNTVDPDTSFESKLFSVSEDMDATGDEEQKKAAATKRIIQQIIEKICADSFDNW